MIIIDAQMKSDYFALTADGHANAARNDDGRDLVCCAVSTIMGTLANSCALIDDVSTMYTTRSGYAHIFVNNCGELWCEVCSRFQMAVDGLNALAAQYPQSLRVTVEN